MCCGSKRLAFRNTPNRALTGAVKPTVQPNRALVTGVSAQHRTMTTGTISPQVQVAANSIVLRHKDNLSVRVRGPVSGRLYDFSSTQPWQVVDRRDAAVLTRGGLFVRA
jgi:hypothetical protein